MARIPFFAQLVGALALSGLVAACGATPVRVAPQKTVVPLDLSEKTLNPIGFAKAVVDIRRGTQIGSYRQMFLTCDTFGESRITWGQGRMNASTIEVADAFYHELSGSGYDVINAPNMLFDLKDKSSDSRVMYMVGARITELQMDLCAAINALTGYPQGTKGDAYVKVNWQVLDVLQDKIVLDTITEGTFKNNIPTLDGEVVAIHGAFANATANLAAEPAFRALATTAMGNMIVGKDGKSKLAVTPLNEPLITVKAAPARRGAISAHMKSVRTSTVLIFDATGHGSGYFISDDGYILSNAHVTGGKRQINVRLLDGSEHRATVLREHKMRDVALLKIEGSGFKPLPVRAAPVNVGEEIYAIGAPLHRQLSHSVTKGIASAIREDEKVARMFIQGDVTIHGGNSGGPLVDASGNLIGMSVAGYIDPRSGGATELNLFIPIHDALEKIQLRAQ